MPLPIRRGGIFLIPDAKLVLLPKALRSLIHVERRSFLVLSGDETNLDADWPVVTGCPLSSSTTYKTRFDVKFAAGEGNVNKKVWVRVPGLQSIEKSDLEDFTGTVSAQALERVDAAVLRYLGQLDDVQTASPNEPVS